MGWGINKRFILWKQAFRARCAAMLSEDGGELHLLQREVPEAAVQAATIFRQQGSPVWYGGQAQWLPTGGAVFASMLEDIRRAKTSVWLEYDHLRPGVMWDTILMALRQRAARGVEVRLIYAKYASRRLPGSYPALLARMHIQALPLPLGFPLRTHRQMTIIDTAIAYTGGVGMSDGQIGVDHRIRPEKDGAVRVEGQAVRGFSAAFAALWETITGQAIALPPAREWDDSTYVYMQPFWETTPFSTAKSALLGMVARAQSELWLMLPSLWDRALYHALMQAARSGVQVHLLLSGKGFGLSRLARAGGRVYSFASGAFHARLCCADEQLALLTTGKPGLPCLGSGLWLYGQAAAPIPAALRGILPKENRSSPVPEV